MMVAEHNQALLSMIDENGEEGFYVLDADELTRWLGGTDKAPAEA